MDALQNLDVNLEMVRDLSLLFLSFKFLRLIKASREFLGNKLTMARMLADFVQQIVGLLNFSKAELGKANFDKGPIVKNLIVDGLHSDNLRHLCFEQ